MGFQFIYDSALKLNSHLTYGPPVHLPDGENGLIQTLYLCERNLQAQVFTGGSKSAQGTSERIYRSTLRNLVSLNHVNNLAEHTTSPSNVVCAQFNQHL